jgi:hypothetical protein
MEKGFGFPGNNLKFTPALGGASGDEISGTFQTKPGAELRFKIPERQAAVDYSLGLRGKSVKIDRRRQNQSLSTFKQLKKLWHPVMLYAGLILFTSSASQAGQDF